MNEYLEVKRRAIMEKGETDKKVESAYFLQGSIKKQRFDRLGTTYRGNVFFCLVGLHILVEARLEVNRQLLVTPKRYFAEQCKIYFDESSIF